MKQLQPNELQPLPHTCTYVNVQIMSTDTGSEWNILLKAPELGRSDCTLIIQPTTYQTSNTVSVYDHRHFVCSWVHAFVTSRIDYGNTLLANTPKIWTEKLQLVLNAATCVITGTWKFDSGLSHILHHDLHWLDVPQRVIFKLCITVYKCLHGLAPKYLAELCVPVADVAGRRQLHSASLLAGLTFDSFRQSLKTHLFGDRST